MTPEVEVVSNDGRGSVKLVFELIDRQDFEIFCLLEHDSGSVLAGKVDPVLDANG